MADISISRPQAGQNVVLEQAAGSRLIFDFPTDQAMLDRVDDNLVLTFEDGSTVTLQNFYTAYTKDSLPEFVIDGQAVAGEQFFAAMGEDLMPAAGPAAGPAVAPGAGSGAAFGDVGFLGGIDRLGGLDIGFPMESEITDTLEGFGGDAADPGAIPVAGPVAGLGAGPGAGPGAGLPTTPPNADVTAPNAAPIITGFSAPSLGVVEAGVFAGGNEANAGVPFMSGQVQASDPEGNPLTYGFVAADGSLVTSLTTPYGVITMGPDGTYTYTLSNEAANGLAAGESRSESFTVYVQDSAGNTTIATGPIDVTIQGTNDIPTLSLTLPEIAVTEDSAASDGGDYVISGTAVGADVDSGAVLRYDFGADANGDPITSLTDDYGTLTIDPATGVYTYTLNGSSEAVQGLNIDDLINRNVTIRVTDEHGAHTEQNLNLTIQGSNDAPIITAVTSLGVTEAGVRDVDGDANKFFEGTPVDVTGQLAATDADSRDGGEGDRALSYFLTPKDGETLEVGTNSLGQTIHTLTSPYGVLTLNTATGQYGFALSNTSDVVQGLTQDELRELGFTVGVRDAQGATGNAQITVAITGTNDRPELAVSDTSLDIIEGEQSVSGDFGITDADSDGATQTLSVASGSDLTTGEASNPGQPGTAASFTTGYGTLTVDPATGKYTFVLNNEKGGAADKLAQGATHTETFTITTTDAHGATSEQTITVTITGTNAKPELTPNPDQMLNVTEAGVITGTNDPTDGQQWADSIHKGASDVEGDELTYFFIAPDGSHVRQLYVIEDPNDPRGYHFSTERDWGTQDHLGTIMLDPVTGKYGFHLNNNNATINGMTPDSDPLVLNGFTMYVKDVNGDISDTVQNYGVTIKGTNDRPEITLSDQHFTFTEDAPEGEQSLSGNWTVIDKDTDGNDQTLTISRLNDKIGTSSEDADGNVSFTTPYGTLLVRPDGTYTFTANNDAMQSLGDDETHRETFTITTTDKWGATHSQDIEVDFVGVNDKPVLTPTEQQVLTVTESGVIVGGNNWTAGIKDSNFGSVDASDVDGDTLSYYFKGTDKDGAEAHSDTMYVISDGAGGYKIVAESAIDLARNPHLGTLRVDAEGRFSFELNNSNGTINSLNPEQFLELPGMNVYASDGKLESAASQDFIIRIQGTNDRPSLGYFNGSKGSVTVGDTWELGAAKDADGKPLDHAYETASSGTLRAYDADMGDAKTYSVTYKGQTYSTAELNNGAGGTATLEIPTDYGKIVFSFDSNGNVSYSYKVDAGYEGKIHELSKDATAQEKFTIEVKDHWGGSNSQDLTVTLVGDNDAPWVSPDPEVQASWKALIVEDGGRDIHSGDEGFEHTISTSGKLAASDAEGDTLTFSLVTEEGSTNNLRTLPHIVTDANGLEHEIGYITLNPDGSYTYTLFNDNAYVQQMGANHPGFEANFWVRVSDGKGGVTYKEMTVTVKGANDAPHISGGNSNVQEDGGLVQPGDNPLLVKNGKVSVSDIDSGEDTSGNVRFELTGPGVFTAEENGLTVTKVVGTYGTLTLRPDGTYTYELSAEANSNMQGTHKDDLFARESFDFKVTTGVDQGDGNSAGNTVAGGKINVSISGTNDAPQIDTDANGNAETEPVTPKDAIATVVGTVTADDIDMSASQGNDRDNLTFRVMQKYDESDSAQNADFADTTGQEKNPDLTWQAEQTVKGEFGSLTIHPDGSYTYTLNLFSSAVKNAAAGTEFNETFRVTVTDHHGATHTVDLPISIAKPNLENPGQGGGSGTPDPDIFIKDVDVSAKIEIQEDKTVDGKFISEGEVEVTFGCRHDNPGSDIGGEHDNHGQDVPVFFAFLVNGEYTQTISDKFGSVTIDPVTGKYTYTLNNDSRYVQELPEGFELQLPGFEVHLLDANGNPLTMENGDPATTTIGGSITGTNDAPTIDSVDGIVVTDGSVTTDGENRITSRDTDKDLDDRDNDGNTTEQQPLTTTFFYNGVAIAPGASVEMTYGTFTLNADGTYSYTLREGSDVVDALARGQSVKDLGLTVEVSDGSATVKSEIPVTVTGKNDTPTLGFGDAGGNLAFTEDSGIAQLSGKALGSDVDAGDTLRYSMALTEDGKGSSYLLTSTHGTMVLDPATGDYKYLLDNERPAVQSLGAGESVTETFWFTVTDQHGASHRESITVTINGTDDRAEVKLTQNVTSLTESDKTLGEPVQLGNIDVKDVDLADRQTLSLKGDDAEIDWKSTGSVDMAGKYGTLTLNADGTYSYTLTSHELAQNAKYSESFTIVVKEYDSKGNYLGETEHEVKVDLTGTNDAPVITGGTATDGLDAGDAALLAYTGKVTGFDVDVIGTNADGDIHQNVSFTFTYNGQVLNAGQTYEATYGNIMVHANGTYTYTIDPDKAATFNLADGQTVVDSGLSVKATDGSASSGGQNIDFSITGTNDAPVITGGTSHDFGSVDDGNLVFNGHVLATDLDGIGFDSGQVVHENLIYSFTYGDQPLLPGQEYAVKYGTLTVNEDGSYTYTINPELDAVKDLHGNVGTDDMLKVDVSDSLSSTGHDITIEVTGAIETPEIHAITSDPVQHDDGALVFSGQVNAVDADGDSLTYAITEGGQYGHLSINEQGEFTYTIDTPPLDANNLPLGSFNENITVGVTDSHGETTSITFEGVFSVDSDAAVSYQPSADSDIWYSPDATPADDQLLQLANSLAQTDHQA